MEPNMKRDKAVEAAVAELTRQSREGINCGFYAYGEDNEPQAFGVDGQMDLVALVEVVIQSLA